jgi:serpin B
MKILKFSFILFAVLFGFSCQQNDDETVDPAVLQDPITINLSETEVKMTVEGNAFAAKLFSTIYENDENIVISPLSLNMALAMVWNGAKNETKQAIQQAMGMGNYPQSDVNKYFKKLREALLKTDTTTKLAIANSIWQRENFSVKQDFYDVNKNYYNAEVRELNFSAPDAPDIINQWCSDNTNGLIKDMIETISPDIVMYLINALYFKGEWANEHGFVASATSDKPFYKTPGQQVSVKMMSQNNDLAYYSDDYVASTALPYGNGAFNMVFILPHENVTFDDMLKQLEKPDSWNRYLNPSGVYDVDLYVPKFKIEYEKTLNEALTKLGMGIAFTGLADFSDISNAGLQISEVKQKATIEVNEEGSEAAAVTTISILETAAISPSVPQPVIFRADRPFLFAIKENSTGTVLFMGKIGNPE